MAIRRYNLTQTLKDQIIDQSAVADRVEYVPAVFASNVLTAPSNITADDTVTIGADTYQVKALTTDSTRTASLANSMNAQLLTLSGVSGTPATCVAGDLLRIDNEIVKIMRVITTSLVFVVARARCGTALAVHTTASVFQASAVSATNVPFGVNSTLTPAVWLASLAAEINNARSGTAANSERPVAKASTIFDPGALTTLTEAQNNAARATKVVAAVLPSNVGLLVRGAVGGVLALATTEGLTAAGNVWLGGATMFGGAAATPVKVYRGVFVPTAAEVTAGYMTRYVGVLANAPKVFNVSVIVTATGVTKAWGGARSYDSTTGTVKLLNNASTDFAATDTIYVLVTE